MDKNYFLENDEQKKEEDYRFVKEVIKKKCVRPKDVLIRAGWIAGGAVLFGVIAAFVFALFLPVFQKEEEPAVNMIDFEEDSPEDGQQTSGQKENEPVSTPVPTEEPVPNLTVTPTPEEGNNAATGGQDAADPDAPDADTEEETTPIAAYREMYDEMQKLAQDAMSSVVTVTGITNTEDWFAVQSDSARQASGLIVADNGQELYILTEYAAVDHVERIVLSLCDGSIVDGRFQMYDPNTGLAILKIHLSELGNATKEQIRVAQLGNSYGVTQGEAVIAIGSPMGYSNSVVYGQITSTTNTISTYDKQYNLFTTNMLGNADGSGVLINLEGEVISVMAQGFGDVGQENVIFGLPISQLKPLIERLSNGEALPYAGIKGQSVTDEVMKQTGMPKGVYVASVKADSPVFYSGIRSGDIIIKYNEETVETISQYSEKLSHTEVGTDVTMTVMRKGAEGYREFVFHVSIGSW